MKAIFVFCEGNHDVTFIVRSLGQVATATWVGDPIGKLPSPLGPVPDPVNPTKPKLESLIAKRYSARTINDLRLQAASHAPPPSFEAILKLDDTLYVLIRCHGDCAAEAAIDLLADVNVLLNPIFGTDVKEVAAAFVFDADDSVSQRESTFATDYAPLLLDVSPPTHGNWVAGLNPVGLYIFHDQLSKKGTLEEMIAPLVASEWDARWNAAGKYLNDHALLADPVSKKRSELLKAQINVTGQFLFPGDPMSVVIGRPKGGIPGLSDSHFGGVDSQSLVSFLKGVPW